MALTLQPTEASPSIMSEVFGTVYHLAHAAKTVAQIIDEGVVGVSDVQRKALQLTSAYLDEQYQQILART